MILKVLSQKSTVNAYKGNKTNTSETYSYEKDLMLPWEHVVTERLELRSTNTNTNTNTNTKQRWLRKIFNAAMGARGNRAFGTTQ